MKIRIWSSKEHLPSLMAAFSRMIDVIHRESKTVAGFFELS
jgi:hypothetical protein